MHICAAQTIHAQGRRAGLRQIGSEKEDVMEPVKDASHLYEVEHRAYHAERPGFRISELKISPTQQVPWHYHSNVQDAFYVVEGQLADLPARTQGGSAPRSRRHLLASGPAGRTLSPMRETAPRPSSSCRASANTIMSRWYRRPRTAGANTGNPAGRRLVTPR